MSKKKVNLINFKANVGQFLFKYYVCSKCGVFDKNVFNLTCEHRYCFQCNEELQICRECGQELSKTDPSEENLFTYFESLKNTMNIDFKKLANKIKLKEPSKSILKRNSVYKLDEEGTNNETKKKQKKDDSLKEKAKTESKQKETKDNSLNKKEKLENSNKSKKDDSINDVEWEDENGNNLIHKYVSEKNLSQLRKFLKLNVDPNKLNNDGFAPIHLAIKANCLPVFKSLLEFGDINLLTSDNKSPIMVSVEEDRLDFFKLLIKLKPDLNIKDKENKNIYDYCEKEEFKNFLPVLSNSTSEKSTKKNKAVEKSSKKENSLNNSNQVKPLVILSTSITEVELKQLVKFAKKFGAKIVTEFSDDVTHLVSVEAKPGLTSRTLKYLKSLLAHKWLLSFNWINDSLKENKILSENNYELRGITKQQDDTLEAPKRSRENQLKLFDGKKFYIDGKFNSGQNLSKNDFYELIKLGGGISIENPDEIEDDDNLYYIIEKNISRSKFKDKKNTILSMDFLNIVSNFKPDF